ncbi:MAG: type II toxin-antitoxin system RelE/ParE family toxin [Armatimonadetes bacterium]|nr:type II toxin-antitoxin system RelE/ParE family toxin [Armatimonadota bacterium]
MPVSLCKLPLAERVPAVQYEFYLWTDGERSPVAEFLSSLQPADLDKVKALLVRVARCGIPRNGERYKRLAGNYENLHEFKLHQVRLYFFMEGKKIVFTEAEIKKRDRSNPQALARADARRRRYSSEK